MKELQMTDDEVTAWIEAGLQCDGVELGDWEQDAIVRYGRHLHRLLLNEMHELRVQNSAQEAIIEKLNK